MFKLLIYLSSTSLIILIIVTAILVKMNWSEKLLSPLLSIALVGTVTTFITVLIMLKESTIEKDLSTVIVIDERTNLPPFISYSDTNEQNNRLSGYNTLANPIEVLNGKQTAYFETPKNFEETIGFCEELLQYKLFKDIVEMQTPKIATTQGLAGVSSTVYKPFKLTTGKNIPLKEYSIELDPIRFSKKARERFNWDHIYFKLPAGTNVSFEKIPSSETSGVEKHKIILQKLYFFKIEITIETFGATGLNSVPLGLQIEPVEAIKTCKTYFFLISLKATFERFTAGNKQTRRI